MDTVKVEGNHKSHKVLLYALSTCAWCKRTKKLLSEEGIEYEFIDVDLCGKEDREKVKKDILSRGGRLSYPVIIVDNKIFISFRLETANDGGADKPTVSGDVNF